MLTHRSAFRSVTVVDGCRRFGPSLESRTHVHLGLPEWWGCPCFLTATQPGRPILSQQILQVQYGDWRAKVRGKRGVHKGRKRGELTMADLNSQGCNTVHLVDRHLQGGGSQELTPKSNRPDIPSIQGSVLFEDATPPYQLLASVASCIYLNPDAEYRRLRAWLGLAPRGGDCCPTRMVLSFAK